MNILTVIQMQAEAGQKYKIAAQQDQLSGKYVVWLTVLNYLLSMSLTGFRLMLGYWSLLM
jgi:hypothetical protein